jgi:hypothetical protein
LWLFLRHADARCSLTHPFSGDVLQLPKVGAICRHEGTTAGGERERERERDFQSI